MKDFWNSRYSEEDFAYGTEPNQYFKQKIETLQPGKILLPAEGEGRNAVFAATKGWEVSAFDQSEEGKNKALKLAENQNVKIDYQIIEAENADYSENSFDVLALIFTHFDSEKRQKIHRKLSSSVKPGGFLILESFSKKHADFQKVNPNAGGPRNPEMLNDLETLKNDFKDFDFVEAEEKNVEMNEGKFHNGASSVIRIFAIKK